MRLFGPRGRPGDSIPTSSMADIAFLLLVFFLVTTVFPKNVGLSLVLPDGEADVNQANVLHLLVGTDGMVQVRLGASSGSQTVPARDIADLWRQAVAANPLLIAAVKTDPEAPYRRMVDVLDQLRSAGAQRVSLQALRR